MISTVRRVFIRTLKTPRVPKSANEIAEEIVCAFDEAGKGAVVGPQLITALTMTRANMLKLKAEGVSNRKEVKGRKEREELYETIKKHAIEYKVLRIDPPEIDDWMFNQRRSFSKLIRLKYIEMLDSFEKQPNEVMVDHDELNVKKHIGNLIGSHPNILWTARKKADYKLPLVGFASIMSVIERERAMEELQKSYPGYELGTGYGNCEVTQRFLRQSLDEGSYLLPVTRVINKAAQKISKQFWAEGGRVPIPSRHLVGQTLGHGDIYATEKTIYAQRKQEIYGLRDKLRSGEELTDEEKKMYQRLFMGASEPTDEASQVSGGDLFADYEEEEEETISKKDVRRANRKGGRKGEKEGEGEGDEGEAQI